VANFPAVLGEFVDEESFGVIDGLVLGDERCTETVVLLFVLVLLHDGAGIEPMLMGVAAGALLAFGGAGASRFLRVGSIGGDLSDC
jgi:hypothetical protein